MFARATAANSKYVISVWPLVVMQSYLRENTHPSFTYMQNNITTTIYAQLKYRYYCQYPVNHEMILQLFSTIYESQIDRGPLANIISFCGTYLWNT